MSGLDKLFPRMKFINACTCGGEEEVTSEQQAVGYVWQCPKCKVVTACVRSRPGPKAWIVVDPKEVEFYDLLGHQYDARDKEDEDEL